MRIVILGAGSWGTALGIWLTQQGHQVLLWVRSCELARSIEVERHNPRFPSYARLPDGLHATTDPAVTRSADLIILAIPTQYIRQTLQEHNFSFPVPIVNVAKGIEQGTLLRISQLLQDVAGIEPEQYAVLSGPSHAEEVAQALPTAVVAASYSADLARQVQRVFNGPRFRVYTSHDTVGVELGGALKNIIAVAAGIVDGLGLGDNAKAALLTRGLAEIQRLGVACGAEPQTFTGLSGLG
ncbi:MAG: NAD(P)-dependent glycerol-3-phosphate dehydrogenase, partial [Candidatus Kapabacteria bacterium]|nr:NAD(P)-dependent glycerol-3-phosphate dehydrogenase [Candidatus Kapabacteria bacterium]MDW8225935.1 NAD(P)H-dependent glycerol-3-phosphate dehydrogenase [Bacteroidota bacterium]